MLLSYGKKGIANKMVRIRGQEHEKDETEK